MNNTNETLPEMREIPGFPNYYVTADNRLYSDKGWQIRELKTRPNPNGYLQTNISINGKPKPLRLHIAVALAWLPPREPHQTEIRHLNRIRTDNRPENLAWGTPKDNKQDSIRHGTNYKETTAATRGNKITAFKRLQQYAAEGYLPRYTNKKLNAKRLRIWLALRRKIMRDAARTPAI